MNDMKLDALIVGEELFKKISDKYGKNTRITKQIIKDSKDFHSDCFSS